MVTSSLYLRDFARRTIEVVLPHEARQDSDAIATAARRVAHRDSRVLAALEDDHDSETLAESRVERLDPFLSTHTFGRFDDLHALFLERKGEARVLFDVERQGDFMVVMEAEGYNVLPDRNFIARVEQLCGRGSVRVIN